jgi:AcrR family transcriptional regulator
MPTGVAIRDPRGQLLDAAERILLRDGPGALTSRSVTAEAGVAKGVLHRHFADFDDLLAELALSWISRISDLAAELLAVAGSGTVAGNLAAALPPLFGPEMLAATALAADYLAAERDLGRITPTADIGTLAPTLIGAVHLLYADADGSGRDESGPAPAAVDRVVDTVLASSVMGSR